MMKERNRKTAFILVITILVVSCMFPLKNITGNVNATTKSPKIVEIYYDYWFYKGSRNYAKITVENMNPNAVYSVSVSNENIAQFVTYTNDEFSFYVKKPGTFKLTIREKYKGKVRKIGTKTITVKEEKSEEEEYEESNENYVSVIYPVLIMEKGMKVPLCEIAGWGKDVQTDFGNEDIASIEDERFIKANGIGTTEWKFTYEKERRDEDGDMISTQKTKSIKITVVEPDKGMEMQENRKLAKQINQICQTKVTSKNANKLLEKICQISMKIKKYSGFIHVTETYNGEYDDIDDYEELQVGQVMIPTNYTTTDFYKVRDECKLKSNINLVEQGVSLEAVKITKLTPKKVTLQLSEAPNSTEVAVLEDEKYWITLWDKNDNHYCFGGDLKVGSKTVTGKLVEGIGIKVGQTYYAEISSKKNKTVKTVKIKCTKK